MLGIGLTNLKFNDSKGEVDASFELEAESDTLAAMRGEPRSRLSAIVSFPYGSEGALQTDVGRQAHKLLLEHLEALVQELREILKD